MNFFHILFLSRLTFFQLFSSSSLSDDDDDYFAIHDVSSSKGGKKDTMFFVLLNSSFRHLMCSNLLCLSFLQHRSPPSTAESRRGRGHLLAARLPAEGRPRAARRPTRRPQRRPLRPQEHPRHLRWARKVDDAGNFKSDIVSCDLSLVSVNLSPLFMQHPMQTQLSTKWFKSDSHT